MSIRDDQDWQTQKRIASAPDTLALPRPGLSHEYHDLKGLTGLGGRSE